MVARAIQNGFTLVEVLVASVILVLVLTGLHTAHIQQRRVSDWQVDMAEAHDGFRIANSILAAELREAVVADGDVVLNSPQSLTVRSPVGFALVCATRANPAVIALHGASGASPTPGTDSILLYSSQGWAALPVVSRDTPGQRGLECPFGTARPEAQYRLPAGSVEFVPVGAPVRVFRTHRYHLAAVDSEPWLARTDASGTEPLVGPLIPEGLRFRYLDRYGVATAVTDSAVGVEMTLAMPRPDRAGSAVTDTMTLIFQGRNR